MTWWFCAAGETRLKKSLYAADGRVICEREGGRRRHILKGPHAEGGWAWTEHRWKRICGLMEKQATKCPFRPLGGRCFYNRTSSIRDLEIWSHLFYEGKE